MSIITENERVYILNSMMELLDEYDYSWEYQSLNQIIDEWGRQKVGLIEAFKKHPNYVEGKFMIAFDADYERRIDTRSSFVFKNWLLDVAIPEMRNTYPSEILAENEDYYYGLPYDIYCFFHYLNNYANRCISKGTADDLSRIFPKLSFHNGQKTSRVVNKICCYLGLDKVDGYNREFAKYADSLSPLVIKRHTVLSINPLDYLTMSFGNSWASCHTIDKGNKRGMPNNYSGCYSSGTISYMLDKVSMVLYTVDASYNGNEYWDQPKINRQMFHYGEDKLIQGRLYPQDNDGDDSQYTPYRNIVQNIVSTIFNVPNLWALSKGTDAASRYVDSEGTHYRDYYYYNNCSLSFLKGSENMDRITVGAKPICIKCGERHRVEDNINHCDEYTCANCGCILDEDDIIWINDEPYCRDCCYYCERCGTYHRTDETYVRNYGWVCEDCISNFIYCECCGGYVTEDYSYYIECEDRYVCDGCCSMYYTYCVDCGEYFPDEDIKHYGDEALCTDCYDQRISEEEETEEDENVF